MACLVRETLGGSKKKQISKDKIAVVTKGWQVEYIKELKSITTSSVGQADESGPAQLLTPKCVSRVADDDGNDAFDDDDVCELKTPIEYFKDQWLTALTDKEIRTRPSQQSSRLASLEEESKEDEAERMNEEYREGVVARIEEELARSKKDDPDLWGHSDHSSDYCVVS